VVCLTSTLMQQAFRIAENEFGARPGASWSSSGQGAVGHVLGLRTAHQSLVMKLFVADSPEEPWERERRALNLTADYADIPVPLLVGHGRGAESPARSQPILHGSFEGIATVTEWHAVKSSSSVPALPDLRPQRGCGNPGLIRC
jgi:hypothetical protein